VLGLVLWRDDVRCVGAATKVMKGLNDVGLAEATSLKEMLNMISSLELNRVIVEMDVAAIVRAVHKKVFPRNQWGIWCVVALGFSPKTIKSL
ncbi:hypothetical protein A2U01_0057473, partial [Trifolium medium]|nr:hypothetical protein [Trifolium medium]